MRFKRKVFLEKGFFDVTPLINVVFLLLIFFMLTASFVSQPGIRVNLPKALTSEVLHKELLVVTITENNEIYINERPVNIDEIMARVTQAARDNQLILIKADRKANMEKIIEIWDVCRQVNVKQVSIATTQ